MEQRLYLVAYDISNPRRWRRVYKLLHGYGEWLQLSVFRCRLDRSRRDALALALTKHIDPKDDQVIIADLGPLPRAATKLDSVGRALPAPNLGPWIA